MERGNAFHKRALLDKFAIEKHSRRFVDDARRAFTNLFETLRCYTDNSTITFDQFRVYHSCLGVDANITRIAYEKMDVNKDGGISEEELCGAGVSFLTGEDENSEGSLFFGEIQ